MRIYHPEEWLEMVKSLSAAWHVRFTLGTTWYFHCGKIYLFLFLRVYAARRGMFVSIDDFIVD